VRQACYPNATCNPPLTCVSDVCVDLSGGGGVSGGTAGRGGGGGSTGTGGVGNTGGTIATAGTGGVGNTGGTTATAGTSGGGGNTGGSAAGTGGVGNTGGTTATAGTGGVGNTGGTTATAGTGGGGNIGGAAATAGAGGVGNTGGTTATAGAGGTTTCASPTSYTQTTISGAVGRTTGGTSPYEEDVQGTLIGGPPYDILDIELFSTLADFPADITTGTFHLTADDGQYLTCGICILIDAKSTTDPNTGVITPQALYLANSGTLTLTSVADKTTGTGTIAGSISNLTFRQVTIDSDTFESTVVGNCTTSLPSLTFSVTSTNVQ